jgi:hypothetical protein
MIKSLIYFSLFINIVFGQYFKTSSEGFKYLKDNEWIDFGKFAAVNLGVTKPGYLPGQVILEKDDYLRRFQKIEKLGIKVIRVYALLHSDFYKTLVEWNENHENKIYLLHGTEFPEILMDENNGTDAFTEEFTHEFKVGIEKTLKGVYGRGDVVYKYNKGVEPIIGHYDTSIEKYLLGWVVAGEISPHCVNRTNNENPNKEQYVGKYISSTNNSSAFEIFLAEMFDYLAELSMETNNMAPVSLSNWATTDGITNKVEPRFEIKSNESVEDWYSSVEDWQEIDLHNIDTHNWEAGKYYNQHIYPYYPEFITHLDDPNSEEKDPYFEYLKRIRDYYSDLPFIITEVGLSTTLGIASFEHYKNRTHGGVSHEHQGKMLKEIILKAIDELDMTGVVIFELQDEWFKRSWNTLQFERNDEYGSGRNYWLNVMSAEQGFGLFEVKPQFDFHSKKYEDTEYFQDITISNDVSHVKLNINMKETMTKRGKIVIGFDVVEGGSYTARNLDINVKNFDNKVDYILEINLDTNKINYYVSGTQDFIRGQYGWWFNELENFSMPLIPSDVIDSEKGYFFPFLQLVKLPGSMIINETYIYTPHEHFEIEFLNEDEVGEEKINTALWRQKDENNYEIKIPYNLLSFSNPQKHERFTMEGFGKEFELHYVENSLPINIEICHILDYVMPASKIKLEYIWDKWEIPECYCEIPKKSFKYMRQAFSEINGYVEGDLTDEEISELEWCSCKDKETELSIHKVVVSACYIFLILCFFYSSIGLFISDKLFYCYSFQNGEKEVEGTSSRLQIINFILLCIVTSIYYYSDYSISSPKTDVLYSLYLLIVIWDSLIILVCMLFFKWNLYENKNLEKYDEKEHAFVISCHNSSNVIGNTLRSLIQKVKPETIFVGDNGSTEEEQELTNQICYEISQEYYKNNNLEFDEDKTINYGHSPIGNKTISQYASVSNLPENVKFVTCIDDDTRLHETWDVNKVIYYFKNDEEVTVLAYPLKADKPKFDIELFEAMEYIIVGFIKICHGKIRSTIFNSGAFGTYRVEVLKEAYQYHNTDFHGDDLQICLNIHQLKGKKYITQEDKKHEISYRVITATDMVVSTIVPKCWIHLRSLSKTLFKNNTCDCDNPDLFGQRAKGWFVSKHRFIPKYIKCIINIKDFKGIWVRLVILYDLLIILNEYFAIFYIIFLLKNIGLWMMEAFVIGISINIFVLLLFNYFILKPNKLNLPVEAITSQPIIYKMFMITIYRYMGLFYNMFIYTPTHKTGKMIKERMKEDEFKKLIKDMYIKREVKIEPVLARQIEIVINN